MTETVSDSHVYDAVIVGGGAAGVGVAIALKHAGVENFVVLERHIVGASFALWPVETRFITPSFPTNSIGMLDLNSIAIGVSPAFSLEVEHPTGLQYASHLCGVAEFFELPIRERIHVTSLKSTEKHFRVGTNEGVVLAKHVVWAAGEFQFPRLDGFQGSDHCRHTARLESYGDLDGDDFIVIGGYESGVDVAYHLAARGKRVRLFDKDQPWRDESSDPSIALSTYSLERMRTGHFSERVELYPQTPIEAVKAIDSSYEVTTQDGQRFVTPVKPLLAGGFEGSHKHLGNLFERREDGSPILTENDESTRIPGLFLCGPSVRHDNLIFCFIYKFRQRFAVVAKAIAASLDLPADYLESYRQWGMYLDDLTYCGEDCVC